MSNLPRFIHLSIYPSMFSHRPFLLPPAILFLLFCCLLFCFLHHLHDVIGLLIIVNFGGWVFNHFSCFTHALTHVLFLPPLLLSYSILLSISLFICCTMCHLPVRLAIIFPWLPVFHSLPSTQHYRDQHFVTHYINPQTYWKKMLVLLSSPHLATTLWQWRGWEGMIGLKF